MSKMGPRILTVVFAMFCFAVVGALGAERDEDAAKEAAQGHSADEVSSPRPAKLPDLTKGEVIPAAPKVGVRLLESRQDRQYRHTKRLVRW